MTDAPVRASSSGTIARRRLTTKRLGSISLIFMVCSLLIACQQELSAAEAKALERANAFWSSKGVTCARASNCRFKVEDSGKYWHVTLELGAGLDAWTYVASIDKTTGQIIPSSAYSVGF